VSTPKIDFFWKNHFDTATVTATSEDPDFPVENLQERWATFDWRSAGVAGAIEVVADLGADWATKSVGGFVLENMNLTAGAAVEIGGHPTDPTGLGATAWSAPITVTAEMIAKKRIAVKLPAEETYRFWRVVIVDAANPDSYLSASRIFFGEVFTGKYHYQPGGGRDLIDPSSIGQSAAGQKTSSRQPVRDTYAPVVTIAGLADIDGYDAMARWCGAYSRPLWVALDSTDITDSMVYISFMETVKRPLRTSQRLYLSTLRMEDEP